MNNFVIINTKRYPLYTSENTVVLNADWSFISNGKYLDYSKNDVRIIVIGDLIASKEELLETKDDEIPKLKGNFYAIVVKEKSIRIYNSFFSILPLYLTIDKSIISSSIDLIKKSSDQDFSIDKKFILENLLFNYGFFNRTKYKEIELVPCNHFIALIKKEVSIVKHYSTRDLFLARPKGGKKTVNELSNLFIKTSEQYFPDESFDIAFTSGFDGRTLVSCATHHNKKFSTFSFGRPENDDVSIPKNNAKELNLPYEYYDLGSEDYIKKEYYKNALEYTSSGYLGNGLLYAHFPYSTKKLKEKSNYLISGVCGSELFRALHITGAVTSVALVDIFRTEDEQELRERIRASKTLDVINRNEFIIELDELITEIIEYKNRLPESITMNQQFYVFVFEEIFRKFFGQWVVIQQQYIKVRTPFLDFNFVKALLETKYAGANNDLFTKNPVKRMKGQYIYADIIKKTNTTIYHQITGKGYTPRDIRNIYYTVNILLPFFKKRLKKKEAKTYLDNLGIISGIKENIHKLKPIIENGSYFNKKKLHHMLYSLSAYTPENERDSLLMSLAILYNLQEKKVEQKSLSA